jgi:hypothetical protein
LNSLEKDVCRLIGESITSPDVFSDITPIRDSVNSAVQELCALTGSYVQPYHMPLYTDRHFYRMGWLHDHFGYVIECWDRQRKYKLGRTDVRALSQIDPWFLKRSGDPTRYFEVGHTIIGIDRAPSQDGQILEMTCAAIPKAVANDGDPVKLRDVFRRSAVNYAVSEFYASRGDAERAKDYLQRYVDSAGLMNIHPDQADRLYQMATDKSRWAARGGEAK